MNTKYRYFLSFYILYLISCILLAGCTTLDIARREEVAQVRTSVSEELIEVKDEMGALDGKIQELQYEIEGLSQRQQEQTQEVSTALNDVKREVTGIRTRLKALDKTRVQDRQELQNKLNVVLQEVTRENKELRAQIEALRKSTAYTGTEGYYVVTQGDTLSGIAQMFGVSVRGIMEINNITDPNTIRAGQKLIIPEGKR